MTTPGFRFAGQLGAEPARGQEWEKEAPDRIGFRTDQAHSAGPRLAGVHNGRVSVAKAVRL